MDRAWLEMVHVCALDQLARSRAPATAPPAVPLYPVCLASLYEGHLDRALRNQS